MTKSNLSSNVPSSTSPPAAFRFVEASSVIIAIVFDLVLAWYVGLGVMAHSPGVLVLLLMALGAYLAADFVSGLVHFLGDSFGSVHTPWLGTTFVLPFRSHHEHPQGICEHDFVETNGNNAFATLFGVVPTLWFVPVRAGGIATAFGAFVLVFSVLLLFTNQIHKWAHVARPPRLVSFLQRVGILLSRERHLSHHTPPYARGFCVTSGLVNTLLDPLGFFPWLERSLRSLLGLSRSRS